MKYGVPSQKFIYTQGMAGQRPKAPLDYESLKQKAKSKLSNEAFAYLSGGAGAETTIVANRLAFQAYSLKARMMQASSMIDLGVTLFGRNYASPILLAPIGVLELAHGEGDLAVAHACKEMDVPMIFSNQASFPMEECSRVMDHSSRWFQLYWSKSDALVQSFIQRAEKCGCEAIVVTLDTTSLGWRPRDLNLGFLPFLRGMGIAQYSSDPVFQNIVEDNLKIKNDGSERPPINFHILKNIIGLCQRYPGSFFSNLKSGRALAAVRTFIDIYMRPELRWDDLPRLRKMTNLPILVKGIQLPEDANKAFQNGADGIIVSNHGGRQIDGGVGALKCLDEITKNVDARGPVLFDSGIRCGADVIKALALGADAVLVGRPYVYGLAIDGQAGVESVIRNFLSELELQLSLMGVEKVQQLNRTFLSVSEKPV